MFFPFVFYKKHDKVAPIAMNTITRYKWSVKQDTSITDKPKNLPEIPKKNGGCILCDYIVISPYNKCKHNYCDYCLHTRAFFKKSKCIFCVDP
jgi:hypothetical protein